MKQTYSSLDLVRFLYHETTVSEDNDIAFLLEDSAQAHEAFEDLLHAKRALKRMPMMRPSTSTLQAIMAHA